MVDISEAVHSGRRVNGPFSVPSLLLFCALLFTVIAILVLSATPPGELFESWVPSRAFRNERLEDVIHDLEVSRVLLPGTTWESDGLKDRLVTLRYRYYSVSNAIDAVGQAADVVIECPANFRCSLCGRHITGAASVKAVKEGSRGGAGARWVYRLGHS